MLLTELVQPSLKDWKFEVIKDGSNGGSKGDILSFDVFSEPSGAYYLTPLQIKQYFSNMKIGDVRIIMAKSGNIKVAREE